MPHFTRQAIGTTLTISRADEVVGGDWIVWESTTPHEPFAFAKVHEIVTVGDDIDFVVWVPEENGATDGRGHLRQFTTSGGNAVAVAWVRPS